MPGLKHPLMGADIPTLLHGITRYGGVAPECWPRAACFLGSAVARLPARWLERLLAARPGGDADSATAPVFIVGHWRSGTTHLHNLLACSPEFGIITPLASGLPHELLTLASWLRPLLEKSLPVDRGVDRVAVTPSSPQEDEIPLASMQPLSVFNALYYPREFQRRIDEGVFLEGVGEAELGRWRRCLLAFFNKVRRHQGGRPPLVKNPAHSARIAQLRAIWPQARFVHIYRNPYAVFPSTVQYFRKLLPELALQRFAHLDLEAVVLQLYPRLLDRLYTATADLPDDRFAEVAFEQLERDPLGTIDEIMRQLELPARPQTLERARAHLDRVAGYRKNRLQLAERDQRLVERHWGRYLRRYQYGAPPPA